MDLKELWDLVQTGTTNRGKKSAARKAHSTEVTFERALKAVESIMLGKRVVSTNVQKQEDGSFVTFKEDGTPTPTKKAVALESPELWESEYGIVLKLNPKQYAERAIMALKYDVSPACILAHSPNFQKIGPWEKVKSALYEIAKVEEVKLDAINVLFGFEEADTHMVVSEGSCLAEESNAA